MDLGIGGKWALVCGASKGLGFGCAQALAAEGVHLVVTARSEGALQDAAAHLHSVPGAGEVRVAVGDIATEEGRGVALAAAPQIDILVTNARGGRRLAISVNGPASIGAERWRPTCWHRSS